MGKCVSSLSDKPELRRTSYSDDKPFDIKIEDQDYSFLQMHPSELIPGKVDRTDKNKKSSLPTAPSYVDKQKLPEPEKKEQPDIPNIFEFQDLGNPLDLPQQDEEMMSAYNTKSKIIKLSKKGSNSKIEKPHAIQKQEKTQKNNREVMEVILTTQQIVQTLSLNHDDIDMEFTLPKCRGGPLVVPSINFEFYSLS